MEIDIAAARAHLQAREARLKREREAIRQQAIQAVRLAVKSILPRFPQVQRVYLFGSVIRPGAFRSLSDVDIAVEGELSAEDYFALWRELDRAVPDWQIDLVELGRDVFFADRVREAGEVIYERPNSDVEG